MPVTEALAPERLSDLPRLLRNLDGFGPLLEALRAGRSGAVDGTWGSAATLTAAALAAETPGMLLVVLAHPGDVPGWADEIASFGAGRVATFPADEVVAGVRLKILQQLQSDSPPRVLMASIASLVLPVPSREELARRG